MKTIILLSFLLTVTLQAQIKNIYRNDNQIIAVLINDTTLSISDEIKEVLWQRERITPLDLGTKFLMKKDGNIQKIYNPLDELIAEFLLNDWQEYKKECWADSTYAEYNYFIYGNDTTYGSINMIDPGFNLGWKGIIGIWHHRESTLEGFMQYIEAKLKCQN